MMKRIILKSGEEDRVRRGHPWVYDNEVDRVLAGKGPGSGGAFMESLLPGECADVESAHKEYLGRAIVNPNSKIIARIYSPSKEGIDKGFFKRRIREALPSLRHSCPSVTGAFMLSPLPFAARQALCSSLFTSNFPDGNRSTSMSCFNSL